MAEKPDTVTYKRLILARQLLAQGVRHAAHHSAINRVVAVIDFDLAIETVLHTIAVALDASRVPPNTFRDLLERCDTNLEKAGYAELPDKANALRVHAIRNDAQHRARYPSESDTGDCRTYTHDFIDKALTLVWAKRLDSLSLSQLVHHEKVRRLLGAAEEAFAAGDCVTAVQQAGAALSRALDSVRQPLVGRLPTSASRIALLPLRIERHDLGEGRDALRALRRMQDTLLFLALGMSVPDFVRFRQIAGTVWFTGDGTPHFSDTKDEVTPPEADFVVSYCSDAVLEIENRVGDLDKPLGREHWF